MTGMTGRTNEVPLYLVKEYNYPLVEGIVGKPTAIFVVIPTDKKSEKDPELNFFKIVDFVFGKDFTDVDHESGYFIIHDINDMKYFTAKVIGTSETNPEYFI